MLDNKQKSVNVPIVEKIKEDVKKINEHKITVPKKDKND